MPKVSQLGLKTSWRMRPMGWLAIGTVSGCLHLQSLPALASCEVIPNTKPINREQVGEVIVIGSLPSHPYLVIIPAADEATLTAIRECVTDAFITDSRLGSYLQAGAFTQRAEARAWADALRAAGFSARIVHRRGSGLF